MSNLKSSMFNVKVQTKGKLVLSDRKLGIALHILLWVIIFIFPIYVFYTFGFTDIRQLSHFYVNAITYGLIFYINYLYLAPRLYFNNKKWQYFLVVTLLITVLFFLMIMISDHLFADHEREKQFEEIMKKLNDGREHTRPPFELFKVVNYLFTSIMITGFALGLGFMERHREDEKHRKELEKEKLHSELAFLKNQISPHFFFNTLNNIYSLTNIDTPAAQESILKLSKLMRYLLYESEHGETMLSHEIDFMVNYISLMKLRLSPKVNLHVLFPTEYSDVKIPPLLFVSFIENAFKHGISHRDASFIDIKMNVEKNKIFFSSENSIGKSTQPSDNENSGIGLENVKKRLVLLFPEKHTLRITSSEQSFKVDLEIELNV
jgi:two-component system, LytTR family, sensor kinase